MALVMTDIGHIAIAKALANETFILGLGGLDANTTPWTINDIPPDFDRTATGLLLPYGYRMASRVEYAQEDPAGIITAGGTTWSTTTTPTRHLYLEFRLDATDAVGQTVYQLGIFMNPNIDPNVPAGTMWFTPQDLIDTGVLLMGENIKPFVRQDGVREVFEFILTF